MKRGWLCVATSLVSSTALAGGIFVPGSGAVSASRAGAAVASADDGEALTINPAGLAKTTGTTITISLELVRYFMSFARRGVYDDVSNPGFQPPYQGQPYKTVTNDPSPPTGIGKFQPIPVVAVVSDLHGLVPGLHLAVGLYAPTAYPFRNMTNGYKFPAAGDPNADLTTPPPGSRYDILTQESRVLLPSIAASYRIIPQLDVGARFTAGNLESQTQVAVWGTPSNFEERVSEDSLFSAKIKDNFIPAFGLGMTYRPTPFLEFGANYSSPLIIKAHGTATSVKGPDVDANRQIGPVPDADTQCGKGGTMEEQKACISLQLPQTATIGGRYKFLGKNGHENGDIELDLGWENWGKKCALDADGQFKDPSCTSPGQYRVVIDSGLYVNGEYQQPLEKSVNNYNLKDTYSVRLGGSYQIPLGEAVDADRIVVRGGISYDSQAANDGWLRAALDGAARETFTVGGAYKTKKWMASLGVGYVYEGSNTNGGAKADGTDCNPTLAAGNQGCSATGSQRDPSDRKGPDPTNPLITPAFQAENPYNQGTFESHYLLLMLGFTISL
ncbi:MAG TPA: outer membrane protein transport protein [Kofleriaceae bacterium]|jgi:long-subunit fatty acid transport protein